MVAELRGVGAVKELRLSIVIVVLLCFVVTGCGLVLPLPSDSSLLARFEEAEPDFNRLLEMFEEDSNVARVLPEFLLSGELTPISEGLPLARWNEYRELLVKLGIKHGIARREESPCHVFLIASARGGSIGEYKGFAYCDAAPAPLFQSLDERPAVFQGNFLIFKHVKGQWYLYYEEIGDT